MAILQWDGSIFKYTNEVGGIGALTVKHTLDETKHFVISTAEINMQFVQTTFTKTTPNGPNAFALSLPVGVGDLVIIWAGYRGGAMPRIFSGVVNNFSADFQTRTLKIDATDIKNTYLRSSDLKDGAPYSATVSTNFDETAEKDISDWIIEVIEIINANWATMVDKGQLPIRIRTPIIPKIGVTVLGSLLRTNVDAIELLTELAYRGGFSFDITSAVIPDDWSQPFTLGDRLSIAGDFAFIINTGLFNDDVFISVEGEDLLNVTMTRGFGRVNVITVESETDSSIKVVYPDTSLLPIASNIMTQGVQHRRFIYPVSNLEEARNIAITLWRQFADHLQFEIQTIGNPFVMPFSWFGLVSPFFATDSILLIEEVTHSYTTGGFTTDLVIMGLQYDEEGKIFQTPEEVGSRMSSMQDSKSEADDIEPSNDSVDEQTGSIDGGIDSGV